MKLSVIISNRNDTVMLCITVRSCIEAFKPIGLNNCEIVIVDNSDDGVYDILQSIIPRGYIDDGVVKLTHQPFPCLFTAREQAARIASGEYISCIDSHMLIGHNMFVDLVKFMDTYTRSEAIGFAHAPINWAHQHERNAKHDRDMSKCELGDWHLAYNHERTISWKGMPWICLRDWFLDNEDGLGAYGALSQHRISWGGGDMHLGIKTWLLGFTNWAVPTSPAIHIGPFPKIDLINDSDPHHVKVSPRPTNNYKYRQYATSGYGPHTLGFLVSCYVLGGEAMMLRNKPTLESRFGRYIDISRWWDKAIQLGSDEHEWLNKRKTMSFEELLRLKPWETIK